MALPLIAAGIAARVVAKKVATNAAKKAVASKALKAASAKNQSRSIAKNSVKKVSYAEKEAKALGKPKKQFVKEVNQFRDQTAKARKSGATAKEKAAEVTRSNKKLSPYKSPEVIRLSGVKPYKITGGAGSTARRTAEKAKKKNGK